jgi:DHA1 family bicyclomycin/chloramphenicol resistance-like MFS transporter
MATATMSKFEFVALMAAMMAADVLAIDVMLPALPQIGDAFGVVDPNDRSLVLTAFLLGFGLPQLLFGPIADRFGRRSLMLAGLAGYIVLSLAAIVAPTFALMLLCRFLQGAAASAIRVGMMAAVRDRYAGREMAEVMSVVLSIFLLVPIVCPSIGQVLLFVGPWQSIFVFMAGLMLVFAAWAFLRLPESLTSENRRPLTMSSILGGFRIVVSNRQAFFYGIVAPFMYGIIVGCFSTAQQVYVDIYGLGPWFPIVFAINAAIAAVATLFTSRVINRFGMRRVGHTALCIVLAVNVVWGLLSLMGTPPFWSFMLSIVVMFPCIPAVFNTTGALSMEPLGAVAGTASSVFGAISTVGGAAIGYAIQQVYDGTVTPVFFGNAIAAAAGIACILIAENGRLFGRDHTPLSPVALELPA